MLENKLFALVSLGCDKNRVDSEKLMGLIAEHGCALTDDLEEANIIIVNTCAFLNSARKEAIDTVLDCNAYRGGNLEKIVVTGCLPQKFADELVGKLTEADVFLGTNDYDKIFEGLEKSYAEEGQVNLVGCGNGQFRAERVQSTSEHYAYLKIADGCFNRCTYCLIPKIRGSYHSYPMEDLLKEAEGLGELSELILVAQDVTRYGEDGGKNRLVELLQKLSSLENIGHIRLLYCYPEAVTDELIAEMKRNPKIYHYLDIPLQHSEDRVLKIMNRRGTRKAYLNLFKKLREEIPDICIRSTFIAGFPTETAEEHENMKAFLREADLDNCGFFAYSKEPETFAATLKGQILQSEKNKRVKALYKVQAEVSAKKLKEMRGKTITVVCDGIDYERECFVGRSYKNAPEIDGKVYFHAMEAVQGKEYEIKIIQTDSYDLYGCTKEYEDETSN
jgi:ribosomal protein S12 methylthiotransferase